MTGPGGLVGGATHLVGVIGWPVTHSLSPVIHNAAFRALELDWVYVPLPVSPGSAAEAVAGLRALGFRGANVTMPHKADVEGAVDVRSDVATRLQAVNTVIVTPDATVGENTDAPGFERFLRLDVGFEPSGTRALLYGAGGAARACALALAEAGLATLIVALREPARAAPLRRTLAGTATALEVVAFDDAVSVDVDLIVNATPLGARGESLPLPVLHAHSVAIDLLYRPTSTPLLAEVRRAGGTALGGLGLLLHQAALSFELWTGLSPPLEVMSAAAVAAVHEGAAG
jgi:shikimate dehydrogenase